MMVIGTKTELTTLTEDAFNGGEILTLHVEQYQGRLDGEVLGIAASMPDGSVHYVHPQFNDYLLRMSINGKVDFQYLGGKTVEVRPPQQFREVENDSSATFLL